MESERDGEEERGSERGRKGVTYAECVCVCVCVRERERERDR